MGRISTDFWGYFSDLVLNQQIGKVFPYHLPGIIDFDGNLLVHPETAATQFQKQGVLVDLFQKAVSEGVVDRIKRLEDDFGQVCVQQIAFAHMSILPVSAFIRCIRIPSAVCGHALPRTMARRAMRTYKPYSIWRK